MDRTLPKTIPFGVEAGSGLYCWRMEPGILPLPGCLGKQFLCLLVFNACGSICAPMASQNQIRKALSQLSNVAAFLKRHEGDVAERTVYRQRAPNPPRMRPSIARRLERALIQEGLLRGQKEEQE